jgi:polyisoprenoid-binding protein YceI
MSRLKLIVLATVLAASPACKKKPPAATEGSAQTSGSSMAGSSMAGSSAAGSSMAGSVAGSGSAAEGSAATDPAPTAAVDFISVFGEHKDKKPDDPVEVHFEKFAVTKATFDPTKIEGGSATIEIDATSLTSGKGGRDKHLSEGQYLNAAKFAKLVINIDNVKLKDGKVYSADAKVKAVGVEKKYPVTFEVVDAKDDWIKIKGEHKFSRLDFKIGTDPKDKDESVAPDLTIKMLLTLKKT